MNEKSFEELLKELEETVARLEKGDCSLEESLSLFEKGMGISKNCSAKLTEAENKIKAISGSADGGFSDD